MGLYHHGKIPVPTDYSDSVNLTCYVLITNYMQLQGCSTIAGSYMCQKNYQTLCRCCDKLMDIKQRKRISNRPDNCDQQDWERWEPPFSSSSRDYQTSQSWKDGTSQTVKKTGHDKIKNGERRSFLGVAEEQTGSSRERWERNAETQWSRLHSVLVGRRVYGVKNSVF